MNSKILFRLALFILLLQNAGCYYDNQETLYPGSFTCQTPVLNPTFNTDVLPLLDARCNNCHSGISPSGGIKLTTYTEVMKYVNNGKLMGTINYSPGYIPMPKNLGKLSTCEIQLLQDWIDTGSNNN